MIILINQSQPNQASIEVDCPTLRQQIEEIHHPKEIGEIWVGSVTRQVSARIDGRVEFCDWLERYELSEKELESLGQSMSYDQLRLF